MFLHFERRPIVSCSNGRSDLRYRLLLSFPERIQSRTRRHSTIQSWTSWRILKRYRRSTTSLHGGTGTFVFYFQSHFLANQMCDNSSDKSSPAIRQRNVLFAKTAR
jgi:hypothetical protein